jgi:hypothetical protein
MEDDWISPFKAFGLLNEEPKNPFGGILSTSPPSRLPTSPSPFRNISELSLSDSPLASGWGNALSSAPPAGSLANLPSSLPPPAPRLPTTGSALARALVAIPEVERKVYFAFSFDDVMRVNNVRHTGKIGPRIIGRSRGFLDRSIWEKRNIKNDENLKRLMQQPTTQSSVTCVLVGADTWKSRWVRYEIALSVINNKGLLAVHINSINFVGGTGPDPLGINPLHFMGIHRDKNGKYYLVERKLAVLNEATGEVGFNWHWYDDYQLEVPRPRYVPELALGAVVPLSIGTMTYDYAADVGSKSIGLWLDSAAIQVGR